MLVYASDRANACTPTSYEPLPEALQTFVERDNSLFAADLSAKQNGPPAYNLTNAPPHDSTRNSMDSTRADADDEFSRSSTPPFDEDEFMSPSDFGLKVDIKQGCRIDGPGGGEDEVHEIKLDPPVEDEGVDLGTEMMERPHGGMIPGLRTGDRGSDVGMEDADAQDGGIGGPGR